MSSHSTQTNSTKFSTLIFNPAETIQTTNSFTSTSILKAVSLNKRCGIFFNPNLTRVNTYDLVSKTQNNATNIINSSLITGIDLSTASFDVGNDCFSVRINDRVLHTNPLTTPNEFALDYLPASLTTLLSPGFSGDFSLMVTNDAISVFVPRNWSSYAG
jgi:hypothetical protein